MSNLKYLSILALLIISCESTKQQNIETDRNIDLPITAVGHQWNSFLNYLPCHSNSVLLIREDFIYGDYTIIELTPHTDQNNRELRLYEFDLMTVNKEYQRRSVGIFENRKSKLRNIMTYIFDYPDTQIPDFNGLSVFNKHEYLKNFESSKKRYNYFILEAKAASLLWLNPNDGMNDAEQRVLDWIEPVVKKISAQERLYFDFVSGERTNHDPLLSKDKIIKDLGDSYIIPSEELRWNVK